MKLNKLFISAIVASTILVSCSSDNEPQGPRGDYDNGILVSNEGAFSGGTGTINYISNDYTTEEAKVYNKVNNENLGTVLQSIGFNGDEAYIVVNVGNKISVANRYTMEKVTSITADLSNPRYIAFANGKGYVTNWGEFGDLDDNYVAVIDLSTNTVVKKITIPAHNPERIISNGSKLYVSYVDWGSANSIAVINSSTDEVEANIETGLKPDEMAFSNDGSLLVSCKGSADVSGKLVKITTGNNTVSRSVDFPSGVNPDHMVYENGKIYFTSGGVVYEMNESVTTYSATELFTTPIYAMNVKSGKLYTADPKDYASNGTLKIWDIATKTEEKSFTVGISPGEIYFNN